MQYALIFFSKTLTREKWFEHIMLREHQENSRLILTKKSHLIFKFIDSIGDMQEKYFNKMLGFKQLYIDSKERKT